MSSYLRREGDPVGKLILSRLRRAGEMIEKGVLRAMFTQVAVVPLDPSDNVPLDVLLRIAAAIQVQVQRDLGPKWGLQAAVFAFPSLEQVPHGTWPVAVTERADLPVDGFHFVMNGLPFGIVGNSGNTENLSVVLSHEIAEMLVDPFGQRTIAGPALAGNAQAEPAAGAGAEPEAAAVAATVDYFVEVCDVCESVRYQINGVHVSDFVLPGYYDMNHSRSRGYSFTGAVSAPRQVRPGGYITWREQFPTNTVFQAFALPDGEIPRDVRALTATGDRESVPNPGSSPVGGQAATAQVPDQLQVLKLPNSPTRAWRELIADLARQLPSQTEAAPESPAATPESPAATPESPAATGDGGFASTFRVNINALLTAMRHQQPPPSLPEILAAIQNPEAAKTLGQTLLTDPKVTAYAERRGRIIAYLKQQESLSGIFGPDLDPELAMWMFMIMP